MSTRCVMLCYAIHDVSISQVDKGRHYVEIFVFSPGCNWLDVVEVKFRMGDAPGNLIT